MKIKPQYIFWILSALFILFGIKYFYGATDLQFHDTYFVIANYHIAILFVSLFLVFGFIYFLLEKGNYMLVKLLTRLHVWGTLVPVILIAAIFIFFNSSAMSIMPRRYYRFDGNSSVYLDILQNVHLVIPVLVLILLIAQLSFIVNLIAIILKK